MSGDLGMAPMPSVSQISMVLAMVVCRHSGRSPFSKRGHSEGVTAPAGREQPAENEWGIIPWFKSFIAQHHNYHLTWTVYQKCSFLNNFLLI